MKQTETTLAAKVASRMCHDLISPLGAVGNGLELLELTSPGEELSLARDSASDAILRVAFFRVAFGHAPEDQSLRRDELIQLAERYLGPQRAQFRWTLPDEVSRAEARAILLGLLCMAAAITNGAEVEIRHDGQLTSMEATAPTLRIEPEYWAMLDASAPAVDTSAATVQFPLLQRHLENIGRAAEVVCGPGKLNVTF